MATYHLRLKKDNKGGKKVSAKAHADYILREGESSQKSDCVFNAVQLPSWADGSPQKFFSAADRYEDKGNRRFKELEMSLPNELNLKQNLEILGELKNASEELMRDVEDFKNQTKKNTQTIFSFLEVREKLSQQCRLLKSEYDKSVDEMNRLRWKLINLARAISMAENIFVHGAFKKLCEEKREYEKAVSNFEKKFAEYQQRESDFKNANWENSAEKIQEQYYLTKEKILLETARQNLQNTKNFLESESEKLSKFCQTEGAHYNQRNFKK